MKALEIGVDVGNYDTKTRNCTIASGFKTYVKKPKHTVNVMEYRGEYENGMLELSSTLAARGI